MIYGSPTVTAFQACVDHDSPTTGTDVSSATLLLWGGSQLNVESYFSGMVWFALLRFVIGLKNLALLTQPTRLETKINVTLPGAFTGTLCQFCFRLLFTSLN